MIYNGKYKVSSPYGERNLNGIVAFHKGVDFVGLDSKEIVSPVNGIVKSSTIITDKSNLTWEWGNYIRIDTEDEHKLFFCHLSQRLVNVGQMVKKGDIIGSEGNTGYSFGSHCHFEVRTNDNISIDPINYLEKLKENDILTVERAMKIVQENAMLNDNTMKYLSFYKYYDNLILKLAYAINKIK